MDFVHDELATGCKLRILTIVDVHSHYYRGADVVATLEQVCSREGCPKTIRVDNGREFISRDLDL